MVAGDGVEGMTVPKLWPVLVLVFFHVLGGGGVKCVEAGDGVEGMVIPIPGLGSY